MRSYDEETSDGEAGRIYGRLEHVVDIASKISGLTQKQYRDWGEIECMDANEKRRGRSLSRRRKERREIMGRSDRESSVDRRDRPRAADEERKKKEAQGKGKQNGSRNRRESRMGKRNETGK